MKYVIGLTALLAIGSLLIAPNSAGAVEVLDLSIQGGSYNSIESTTTFDNYPSNNSFDRRDNYTRDRYQHPQQTINRQQQNFNPNRDRSNCSTSIIGSPIPSPIPLRTDGYNQGQLCR
jgi:hypothetical protein